MSPSDHDSISQSRQRGSRVLRGAIRKAMHLAAPAAFTLLSTLQAEANPEAGIVVRGTASIEAAGPDVLNVNQATDRAVINWRSFSIGQQEQVNFNQPAQTSATLNRVLGSQRSVIEGALSANGQVFLLNSSGVLFTPTAKVDVGGLVATTSALGDDDFMAGQLGFSAAALSGAQVINEGAISIRDGGFAALVAPAVRNQGMVSARLGRIALGAGETYTLDLYGDRLINFALPKASAGQLSPRAVDQAGSLIADSGRVLLTTDAASGIVGGVVNMSGIIQARTVAQSATGHIVLAGGDADVHVAGTLDASGRWAGASGGTVDVFGETVALTSAALIDASGSSRGGVVRIGGGASGSDTPRATQASVAAGAVIDVSAIDAGNGGTATVWGDEAASFGGAIHARGGRQGGDGGFVEVSTRGLLQFLGDAIVDAPMGQAGLVLLDPPSIRVEATGSIDPNAAIVSAAALNGMLRRGTSVVLLADDSITVNAVIDGRSVNGAGPSGLVQMTAGAIVVMQPILTERNSIALNATTGNVTFGANAYLYVADSTAASGVGTSSISINAQGSVEARSLISLGQVAVTATTGNVSLAGQFGLDNAGAATGIGSLTVTAGGNAVLQGARASGAVNVTAAGTITNSTASIVSGGNVALTAGAGGINLAAFTGNTVGIDAAAAVSLQTPGAVTLNSGIRAASGNLSIGANTPAERVASIASGAGATLRAGGSVNAFANGDVSLRGIASGGSLVVDTTGRLTNADSSLVATSGGITLAAGGDPNEGMDLRSAGSSIAAVDAASGAQVNLRTSGAVTVGGGIRALNGAIDIGSDTARVASLNLLPGATLQTFAGADPTGSVNIYSTGNVAAQGAGTSTVNLITGALNVDSEAGAVSLDGLFGVTGGADGIGTLTINAGGTNGNVALRGARTSGAVNVTAGGNITNTVSSIISAGNVALTAGAAGIALAALDGNAPGIDATGSTATVSLQTPGGAVVLDSGIRTAGGGIAIGTNTPSGRVASVVDATAAPADTVATLRSGGAGNIDVYALNAVALRGIASGGAIVVDTTGRLTNADNSIVAAGGGITLAAGGDADEGMDLRSASSEVATVDAASGTQVTLQTTGSVTLAGGIRALNGAIDIGSNTAPVSQLTLLPGTTLQTFSGAVPAGSIDIYSTAGVNAQDAAIQLITGALNVDSLAGDVLLDSLFGVDNAGVASGIGSLTVNAGGAAGLRGALTSGDVAVTAAGVIVNRDAPLVAGGNVSLQTPAAVMLNSDIRSTGGDIAIGADAPVLSLTMAADVQLRADSGDIAVTAGTGGVRFGSIVGGATTGITVRSDSDVQFLAAVTGPESLDRLKFLDVQAANVLDFTGVRTAGQSPTGEGIRLVVPSGGSIDVLGALDSEGGPILLGLSNADALTDPADYGVGGSNALINLSNGLYTANHAITINGDVTLFEGIGRWDIESALNAPGDANALLTGVFTLAPRGFPDLNGDFSDLDCDDGNSCASPGSFFAHNPEVLCLVDSNCTYNPIDNPSGDDETFLETLRFNPPAGGAEAMRFAGTDFVAYDNLGNPLSAFNTQACGAWICGYDATATVDDSQLLAAAVAREDGLRRLLGVLTSTIDTTTSGGAGASVTVRGNLRRYAPGIVPPAAGIAAVYDSFVNHELLVDVGDANAFTVNGVLGDSAAEADATGRNNNNGGPIITTGVSVGMATGEMPTLGMFGIRTVSGTVTSIGNDVTIGFANRIDGIGVPTVTETVGQYLFTVPWTSPSPGGPGNGAPGGSIVFNPPAFDNTPGGGATIGAGNTGSSTTGLGGGGSQGVGAGSTVGGNVAPGAGAVVPSDPAPISFGVLSTADSQQRDDNAEDADGETDASQQPNESSDRCARGPAQVADLGATPAVDGAAADVFARCPEGR